MSYPFNIRVYFLLWNEERRQLLFSSEKIGNRIYLKFPGGGLEYGEGTRECVEREGMEELGVSIRPEKLFGMTENFLPSLFKSGEQVLAIYYLAGCDEPKQIHAPQGSDYDSNYTGPIWLSPERIDPEHLVLASDKEILEKFKIKFRDLFA